MNGQRSPAWWPMRILLAIGIGSVLLILAWAWLAVSGADRWVGLVGLGPLQLPFPVVVLLVAVVGLIWMIRIFRGPRDEPPPWRYRDR